MYKFQVLEFEDSNPPPSLPPLPFKNASFWHFWPKNQTKVLTSKFFLHGEASRTYISFKCWSLKTQILLLPCLLPPLPLKNASFWHFWPEKHLLTNT